MPLRSLSRLWLPGPERSVHVANSYFEQADTERFILVAALLIPVHVTQSLSVLCNKTMNCKILSVLSPHHELDAASRMHWLSVRSIMFFPMWSRCRNLSPEKGRAGQWLRITSVCCQLWAGCSDPVTPCFWSCLVRDWDVQTSPITEMSKQVFENLWSCTRQPRSFKQQCSGWEFRQFVVRIPSEFFLVFFRGNTNEPQSKVKNLMLHLLARHVPWLKRDKLVFVSFLCKEELEWDLKPNVKTAFAEKVHWSQNAIQNSRGH